MPREQLTRRRTRTTVPEPDTEEYEDERDQDRPRRRSSSQSRRSERDTPRDDERRSARRSSGGKSSGRDKPVRPGGRGWDAHKRNKAASSKFSNEDKLEIPVAPEELLIKFLEPEPFWSYRQHWVNEISSGRRSFACLEDDCPLCDLGLDTRYIDLYNVLDLNEEDPKVKFWEAGPSAADAVNARNESSRTSPIDDPDHYFVVQREKKKEFPKTTVEFVSASDLVKQMDVEPLTDDELDEYLEDLFDESIIKASTRRELQEIADEIDD